MSERNRRPLSIDPAVFRDDGIPEAVRTLNREIVERLSAAPDMWLSAPARIRQDRADGKGYFPLLPPDPDAEELAIDGPRGPLRLRVIRPGTRDERGVYLHFHGGGWVIGAPRENDVRLRAIAEKTGLAAISVDYALAPEEPYPAAPDDCEAAALWLLSDAAAGFERSFLAIGGESAGAHLSVATLLRLRDRHGVTPFHAANLTAGMYDLGLTPSARNWGTEKLILNTRDLEIFTGHFLGGGEDRRAPEVSPLYADLSGLPPALFTCGTRDLLIDDTIFMAARWQAANGNAEISLWPGGCHVFQAFPTSEAARSRDEIDGFLHRMIDRGKAA